MKIIFALLLLASGYTVSAQTKQTQIGKPVVLPKYKVPKMSTLLGPYKDSVGLPVDEINNIIALPLRIVDEKKVVYKVSSYQLVYMKVGVSETEDGKVIPATSISAQLFKETPVSAIWINTIRAQLRKGEALYFFDVIAKDPQGRILYAPSLKLTAL